MKGSDIKVNNLVDSIFLLFIGLGGGFIGGGLMNCSVQRFLKHPLAINGLLFILLFFTSNFTSDDGTKIEVILVRTLILYALFILLLKNEYRTLIISFLLLFTVFLLDIQIKYYKAVIDSSKNHTEVDHVEIPDDFTLAGYENKIKDIENARDIIEYVLLGVLILGMILYFNKQYRDHYENFNLFTFFLGTGSCDK